jgi:hypothetical protein
MAGCFLCPAQQFCFQHPPELRSVPQQIIDSTAGRLQSDTLELDFDLGLYSSDFSSLPEPIIKAIIIDNLKGDILISGHVIALRIAEVKPIPAMNNSIKFALQLTFSGPADEELALKIFNSIKFAEEMKK